MEVLGGIVLSVLVLALLALLGLTTVFALAFMTALGLLTDMSFKRVFFVSFAMALAAPVLLTLATYSAFEDGSLERDLRAELGDVIAIPDERVSNWQDSLDELRQIGQDVESGALTEQQAEERVKELFGASGGAALDRPEVEAAQEGDGIQTEID
ncbi:MAG: hypothetical protein QNI87_05215 [Erythrobacter sp.]|uniref:hypothetical protein n=1 Tax=Erythrobacter sp. TaxID=1042 RepID=UPI002630CD24|nr:hypothetical protein [Erythrobacter sp.]MDJ0977917.1 hypothetical protein [Erythrobacter sp.]